MRPSDASASLDLLAVHAEMIHDLAKSSGVVERQTDVVIIGGGIAGLILAQRLARRHRVIVLESGALRPSDDANELNAVEQIGSPYRAPDEGRTRGLGGTSNKWGGALLPFEPGDFAARPDLDRAAWPVGYDAIATQIGEVERLFGLVSGPYDQPVGPWFRSDHGDVSPFVARFAKWPSFARRNVATLLRDDLKRAGNLEIWLNATCAEFAFAPAKSGLQSVTALANGAKLIARGRHFVLAAGAIESTRLLLWAQAQPHAPSPPSERPLGLYLHDHLSAQVATIDTDEPIALNRLAGFRFDGATMRSFRLELSPEAQRRLGAPGGFAHIAFTPLKPSGFEALRDFMRGIQARRFELGALQGALADAPYLAQAAYWRLIRRQLYWPRPARYELHTVIEQRANRANRISLGAGRDRLGVPKARIEWRVMDADIDAFRTLSVCLDGFWSNGPLGRIGRLKWREPPHDITHPNLDLGDVYHPGGTTRMGDDPQTSVVDRNLTVWDIPNLSVVATSTFPSGASANPTMTLIAFVMRLGIFLDERLLQKPIIATRGVGS